MNWTDTQIVLASVGYYKGAIDGIPGRQTWAAIRITERGSDAHRADWTDRRRQVAAVQEILAVKGYEPGPIDGYFGHNTAEALTAFLSDLAGTDATVDRQPAATRPKPDGLPTQAECPTYYGDPVTEVPHRLGRARFPFPFRLDWALDQAASSARVHERCVEPLESALAEVAAHYGEDRMRRLGIDRYAGGYVKRRMRGGRAWSMHAYGCAVDFYAAPNGLRTPFSEALFGREEYRPFLDIMEAHGWLNGGRLWGRDAMHFQMARM